MLRIKNTNKPAAYTSNMKKKIVADLTSLAHKVLQLKNHETAALKDAAHQLYEKLSVLDFIEKHYDATLPTIGKSQALAVLEDAAATKVPDVNQIEKPTPVDVVKDTVPEKIEEPIEDTVEFDSNDLSELFVPVEDMREVMDLPGIATIHKMVDEFPDLEEITPVHENPSVNEVPSVPPVPVAPPPVPLPAPPVLDDLEKFTKEFQSMPEFERKVNVAAVDKPQSINDRLNKGLTIGINDRLGFVKNLFGGSDQDLNRVLSQLNSMETFSDAKNFVTTMVKPDYNNWSGKESFEERFMELLERNYEK